MDLNPRQLEALVDVTARASLRMAAKELAQMAAKWNEASKSYSLTPAQRQYHAGVADALLMVAQALAPPAKQEGA